MNEYINSLEKELQNLWEFERLYLESNHEVFVMKK